MAKKSRSTPRRHQSGSRHQAVLRRLQRKKIQTQQALETRFAQAVAKLQSLNFSFADVRARSVQALSALALASAVMATSPVIERQIDQLSVQREAEQSPDALQKRLHQELLHVLPQKISPLSPATEQYISSVIQQTTGISATAQLDGQHLNSSYGYIGAEQHLPRFPGDSISLHDALQFKGITANRGAFGYFAPSAAALTPEAFQQEKYYVAVQTLYLPNWNKNHRWLKEWYKFRKVLVVNPKNGKSAVAVVGDAGPAAWTGKQFGGSPELMEYLQLKDGKQKSGVLVFFVAEDGSQIALGPVESKHVGFVASN